MNKERVQQLLDYIKQLPDENFYYGEYLVDDLKQPLNLLHFKAIQQRPLCGTAGCVAGHCCLLFWEDYVSSRGINSLPSQFAKEYLGLDCNTTYDLFIKEMNKASRQDAIARLEHLLTHEGSFSGYSFLNESYVLESK